MATEIEQLREARGAAPPPRRRRGRALTAVVAVVVLAAAVLVGLSWSWGQALAREQRLLPGTAIAGVDVGGWTVAEARDLAHRVEAEALARPVAVRAGDERWEVTAAELGGGTDADAVVTAAFDRTTTASVPELVRTRWLDQPEGFARDVAVSVDADAVAAHVDALADGFDREPVDAALAWSGGELAATAEADGRAIDRAAAAALLQERLEGGGSTAELDVAVLEPAVTDAMVTAATPAVATAVDAALDRVVTVTTDDGAWPVSARQLGSAPAVAPLLEAALAGEAVPVPDLDIPEDAVADLVAGLAIQVDVAARDASVDASTGWVRVRPERAGRALVQEEAGALVHAALRGGEDTVALPVAPVAPSVTSAAYRTVLLVRQGDRRLHLYRDGEIVRSWPVSVGAGGHDTPTGVFRVGAKRHSPTWHNPSPNGWGASMPASIGPGPDNPLGLRALNWTRGGRDTLIRFHGTANLGSIGEAASKGCVRLANPDIVELYDLVPTGTTIVSIR